MSYFFRVIMKYADSTASGLFQNQGRRQPDEHDFDPHLFQPTHPNDDDEGDETDIIGSHHIETQDFFIMGSDNLMKVHTSSHFVFQQHNKTSGNIQS